MRVVEISRAGGPEVLRIVERPRPAPGPGEIVIAVRAAGVNRPDLMQREGRYPAPAGASDLPGLEVAGVVHEAGEGVTRWSRGDAVCALTPGGGYAEYCVVPAPHCLPVPFALGADDAFIRAAALPEACFTVWTNVFERGRLVAGETLLVHGGTSGIGTTAIQLAAARGATVLATAGGPAKCRAAEQLGARRGIDYRSEDFVEVVKTETSGRGVDVILDIMGGDYLDRNLRCLAVEGRLVQIGLQGGPVATMDLSRLLTRRLTVTGSTLRPRSIEQKAAIARDLHAHVWPLVAAGRMPPVIDSVYPLARAADAHRRLESGEHIGKVVLTV